LPRRDLEKRSLFLDELVMHHSRKEGLCLKTSS
jgi:Eukaryotic cytochrome b561